MRNKSLVLVLLFLGILLFLGAVYKKTSFERRENVQTNVKKTNVKKTNDSILNNIIFGGELAEEDGKVYFSNADDGWCLYARSIEEGGEEHKLNNEISDNINVGDGWLFYRDVENHNIIKMSMDGSEKEVIYSGIIDNLIYDKGNLYFLEENEGKQYITKIGSDGLNQEKIFSDSICNLILRDNWFYYYSIEDGMIKKVKINGTSSRNVYEAELDFFIVDDRGIYFTDKDKQKIVRIDYDGNKVSVIIDNYADCINISDDGIYYSIINGCIWRNKIGTKKTEKYIESNSMRFYITESALLYDYIEKTGSEEKICQKLIIREE